MASSNKNFTLNATPDAAGSVLLTAQSLYNKQFAGVSKLEYAIDESWSDGGILFYGHRPGKIYLAHIGVNKHGLDSSTEDMVSDLDMTRILVAVGHEAGHMHDMQEYMSVPNDPVGMRLSAEMVACHDNQAYYFRNYSINESEIRAEKQGIFFAKSALINAMKRGTLTHSSGKSIDECVESLLVDYVNYRRRSENIDYYISPAVGFKFLSLSEIESAFDKAIDKSPKTKRVYPATKAADTDVFPKMVGIAGQKRAKYDTLGKMFKHAVSPYEQNLMMAAVTAFGFPGRNQALSIPGWFPALKDALPLHPIDCGCGNPAVAEKRDADYKTTMQSAFGGVSKRMCPNNPESLIPDVGPSDLSSDYRSCSDEADAIAFARMKQGDSVYMHFRKIVSDARDTARGRNLGPDFSSFAKTTEDLREEYGDSW